MASLGDVSSEEEDMFVQNKGDSGATSFFSQTGQKEAAAAVVDDDDDDLELTAIPVKPKRKRARGRPAVRPCETISISLDSDSDAETPQPAKVSSVFSSTTANIINNNSNGNCEVIDLDLDCADEVNTAVAKTQIETARLLQRAKQSRHGTSLEEQLEQEAMQEAKRQAEILDRQVKEKRQKCLAEKAAAERTAAAARAAAEKYSSTPTKNDTASSADADNDNGDAIVLRVRYIKKFITIKILKTEPLLKMLPPFCERIEIDPAKAVMEIDGEQVEENDTVDTYDLEDNMIVDVRLRK